MIFFKLFKYLRSRAWSARYCCGRRNTNISELTIQLNRIEESCTRTRVDCSHHTYPIWNTYNILRAISTNWIPSRNLTCTKIIGVKCSRCCCILHCLCRRCRGAKIIGFFYLILSSNFPILIDQLFKNLRSRRWGNSWCWGTRKCNFSFNFLSKHPDFDTFKNYIIYSNTYGVVLVELVEGTKVVDVAGTQTYPLWQYIWAGLNKVVPIHV